MKMSGEAKRSPAIEFDAPRLSAQYKINWRSLQRGIWDEHRSRLEAMGGEKIGLIEDLLARPLRPFLTVAPTPLQRAQIDDGESLALAEQTMWQQEQISRVPIEESGERFMDLIEIATRYSVAWEFSGSVFHAACGEWAGKSRVFFVREQLSERLIELSNRLSPLGISLFLEDAFRPPGVQEGLVARRIEWVARQHADWSQGQILTEVRSKTAVTPRLASHKSGAAIDLRLRWDSSNEFLDIGHEYAEGGALVQLDSPFVTQEQWQNRQLLLASARVSGLAMYPGEDWHLSFGDNLACWVFSETPARYGPVKSFDQRTGELSEIYASDELDRVMVA